jgi:hypothetical protein
MDSARKILQMIRWAMLVSVLLYVAVGEFAARPPAAPPNLLLFYVLTFMAVTMVAVIMMLRRLFIKPAVDALGTLDTSPVIVNRWRTGYIVSYALSEAIALYGLVLRFLGFTLSQVAPFYVAGIILLLLLSPRRSEE